MGTQRDEATMRTNPHGGRIEPRPMHAIKYWKLVFQKQATQVHPPMEATSNEPPPPTQPTTFGGPHLDLIQKCDQ